MVSKRLIAREWLLFVLFVVPTTFVVIKFYFQGYSSLRTSQEKLYSSFSKIHSLPTFNEFVASINDESRRRTLFDSLVTWLPKLVAFQYVIPELHTENPALKFSSTDAELFEYLSKRHSNWLDEKIRYSSWEVKYDLGLSTYSSFCDKYVPLTFSEASEKLYYYLFSGHFDTWFSILSPYMVFLFLRFSIWSIRQMIKK